MPHRAGFVLLALALACGPKPGAETAGTTTTSESTTDPATASTTGGASTTGATTTTTGTTESPTTEAPPFMTFESTTGSTSGGFIAMPDVAGPHCGGGGGGGKQCDPWAQDCPAGEKCVPTSDGCEQFVRFRCTAVVPTPAGLGEPCTLEGDALSGVDNCDFGATCWFGDPETLTGTCVALCTGSEDLPACADPATSCVLVFDEEVGFCLPPCDPAQPDCPKGHSCHPNPHQPDVFACLPDA